MRRKNRFILTNFSHTNVLPSQPKSLKFKNSKKCRQPSRYATSKHPHPICLIKRSSTNRNVYTHIRIHPSISRNYTRPHLTLIGSMTSPQSVFLPSFSGSRRVPKRGTGTPSHLTCACARQRSELHGSQAPNAPINHAIFRVFIGRRVFPFFLSFFFIVESLNERIRFL